MVSVPVASNVNVSNSWIPRSHRLVLVVPDALVKVKSVAYWFKPPDREQATNTFWPEVAGKLITPCWSWVPRVTLTGWPSTAAVARTSAGTVNTWAVNAPERVPPGSNTSVYVPVAGRVIRSTESSHIESWTGLPDG